MPEDDDWVGAHDGAEIADLDSYRQEKDEPRGASWEPRNLADVPDEPPVPPTLGNLNLLYPGKRHVFSGPQESAKTLAAYIVCLCVIREGGRVILIDFEMGEREAKRRFVELGATKEDFASLDYIEPEERLTPEISAELVKRNPQLVVVDAAAGAYDLQELDDNKRGDVERFASTFMRPFWRAEVATLVIDHVVKNSEARGNYVIGSERKVGGLDVHLGFSVVHPIKRGTRGVYKITNHKDRGGFHKRGKLADFELQSDPDTHHFEWKFVPAVETDEEHPFRPTGLMEAASRYIETLPLDDPPSRNQVVEAIKGKSTDYKRQALDRLRIEGYVLEEDGPRRAKLLRLVRRYREDEDEWETTSPLTSPDFASNSAETTSPLRLSSYRRGEVGDVSGTEAKSPPDDGIPF